ncbi:MAG: VPDSG-CTERM sorting domain-containing protein [Candidatus Acidiferrales bacterium]
MADPVSTPEPSSFALLGIGLLGLAMLKRRVTMRSLA